MQDTLSYSAYQIAQVAAEKVLMELNIVPEIITYSQIRKLYGKKLAEKARISEDIEWFPMSPKGTGVAVYCKKSEFTEFLFDRKKFQ
jgi:hypothetical protein